MNDYSSINKKNLKILFRNLIKKSIAVIGDFCLDAYWIIDPEGSEISLETGLSTRAVRKQRYAPGGAGNVANNLKHLGVGRVKTFGVIGKDPFGSELKKQLKELGCDTSSLLVQTESWETSTYAKPLLNSKEESRIDFGSENLLSDEIADRLINLLESEIEEYDLVVINQQLKKGLHQKSFPKKLQELICSNQNCSFIADCRDPEISYSKVHYKMNEHEAQKRGLIKSNDKDFTLSKDKLSSGIYKNLFISKGSDGCLVLNKSNVFEVPTPMGIQHVDSVGAGDSMLSGISVSLCSGWDSLSCGLVGSLTAAVTVQKNFQTGTANPKEIMKILDQQISK